jgi:hypothetical protein
MDMSKRKVSGMLEVLAFGTQMQCNSMSLFKDSTYSIDLHPARHTYSNLRSYENESQVVLKLF